MWRKPRTNFTLCEIAWRYMRCVVCPKWCSDSTHASFFCTCQSLILCLYPYSFPPAFLFLLQEMESSKAKAMETLKRSQHRHTNTSVKTQTNNHLETSWAFHSHSHWTIRDWTGRRKEIRRPAGVLRAKMFLPWSCSCSIRFNKSCNTIPPDLIVQS